MEKTSTDYENLFTNFMLEIGVKKSRLKYYWIICRKLPGYILVESIDPGWNLTVANSELLRSKNDQATDIRSSLLQSNNGKEKPYH